MLVWIFLWRCTNTQPLSNTQLLTSWVFKPFLETTFVVCLEFPTPSWLGISSCLDICVIFLYKHLTPSYLGIQVFLGIHFYYMYYIYCMCSISNSLLAGGSMLFGYFCNVVRIQNSQLVGHWSMTGNLLSLYVLNSYLLAGCIFEAAFLYEYPTPILAGYLSNAKLEASWAFVCDPIPNSSPTSQISCYVEHIVHSYIFANRKETCNMRCLKWACTGWASI